MPKVKSIPTPANAASPGLPLVTASPMTLPQMMENAMAAQGSILRRELPGCAIRPTAAGIGTHVHVYIPVFWSNSLLGRMMATPFDT